MKCMNCILPLVKSSIIFGTGVYAGVYIAQNYEIEKVEDPKVLFEKVQAFVKAKLSEASDDSRKDK